MPFFEAPAPSRIAHLRSRYAWAAAILVLCAAACASSPPPKPAAKPKPAPAPVVVAEPEPAPPPVSTVKIKGITGTLNKDDVHQTMEARQQALDGCIAESRRKLRWIHGSIRFAFKVNAAGAVEDVHATQSDIGHRVLETCLLTVLAETVFPKPAGSATAQFDWGLSIVPATSRIPEAIEAEVLEKVLRKHTPEIMDHCEVKRREHFTVTAYLSRRGKVVSAGAVPEPARAIEKVECVLGELASLRMPKLKRDAKVSFKLR